MFNFKTLNDPSTCSKIMVTNHGITRCFNVVMTTSKENPPDHLILIRMLENYFFTKTTENAYMFSYLQHFLNFSVVIKTVAILGGYFLPQMKVKIMHNGTQLLNIMATTIITNL